MQIIYTQQPMPTEIISAIFLAGPTPRSAATPSWRPDALRILASRGYEGTVFIPEFEQGPWQGNYEDQVAWEEEALNHADCILFWIPRDLETMPAFTTNDEWGWWKGSGKVVLGAPDHAEKVRYQQWWADHLGVPSASTLEGTIDAALAMMGAPREGDLRRGAEAQIPLTVWRKPELRRWYATQTSVGNRLERARLLWTFRVGPKRDIVFFWALHVSVYVTSEGRIKKNEILVGRADVASTLLFRRGPTLRETEVVLVREFRSPGTAPDGFVHELPGGSSWHGGESEDVALDELREEIGYVVPTSSPADHAANDVPHRASTPFEPRLRSHGARPLAATLSVHHGHLFSREIRGEEMEALRARAGTVMGQPGDSERTWVEIRTVGDLLDRRDVDWSTIGMILSALTT